MSNQISFGSIPKKEQKLLFELLNPSPQLAPLLKNKKGKWRKHRWIVANEVHNLLLITEATSEQYYQTSHQPDRIAPHRALSDKTYEFRDGIWTTFYNAL